VIVAERIDGNGRHRLRASEADKIGSTSAIPAAGSGGSIRRPLALSADAQHYLFQRRGGDLTILKIPKTDIGAFREGVRWRRSLS
jgi:hypothetical protein